MHKPPRPLRALRACGGERSVLSAQGRINSEPFNKRQRQTVVSSVIKELLRAKVPAGEIPVVMLIAFLVAAQEAVAVSLLVSAPAAENGEEAGAGALVKVGALRVVALTAPGVVRARVEAVPVALVVGVRAVLVAAVVR